MPTTVHSKDGTPIAVDHVGSGPALILVDGALCHRTMGPSGALAKQLAGQFTVYTYDRRGRGESGNLAPYSVQCEVEDLQAVIQMAGGSVYACGISSGAVSPVWMRNAQRALAAAVPGATTRTLPGQTHIVSAKVLAPALVEFFSNG